MDFEIFNKQIKSIRYAIKEMYKELARAESTGNLEWMEDTHAHIKNLNDAIDTIEAMKALEKVFKK